MSGSGSNNKILSQSRRNDFSGRDIFIESFGVKIRFSANNPQTSEVVEEILNTALPECFQIIDKTDVEHSFELILRDEANANTYLLNGAEVPNDHSRADVLNGFQTTIRLTVAEYAVGRVFVHAGVVGWKGKTIIVPGSSFSGKTSLVAALIKLGAEYFSDEFAVFDDEGFVHPFPKTLSIRGEIDEYTQKEYPIEAFGGRRAFDKRPSGLILLTAFRPDAKWRPEIITTGMGMLEILPHAVPIRRNPKFSVKVLNQAGNRAIIAKTYRPDVSESAKAVLDFFESVCL